MRQTHWLQSTTKGYIAESFHHFRNLKISAVSTRLRKQILVLIGLEREGITLDLNLRSIDHPSFPMSKYITARKQAQPAHSRKEGVSSPKEDFSAARLLLRKSLPWSTTSPPFLSEFFNFRGWTSHQRPRLPRTTYKTLCLVSTKNKKTTTQTNQISSSLNTYCLVLLRLSTSLFILTRRKINSQLNKALAATKSLIQHLRIINPGITAHGNMKSKTPFRLRERPGCQAIFEYHPLMMDHPLLQSLVSLVFARIQTHRLNNI